MSNENSSIATIILKIILAYPLYLSHISNIINESTEVQTLGVIRIQLYIVSIF